VPLFLLLLAATSAAAAAAAPTTPATAAAAAAAWALELGAKHFGRGALARRRGGASVLVRVAGRGGLKPGRLERGEQVELAWERERTWRASYGWGVSTTTE
jgi:hypothetical protein